MLCPNCDHMLNGFGCQRCGWRHGDPHPNHRKHPESAFPFKVDGQYPPDPENVQAPPPPELPLELPAAEPDVTVALTNDQSTLAEE